MSEEKTCPECEGKGRVKDDMSSSVLTMATMGIFAPLLPVDKMCPVCYGKGTVKE